MRNKLVVMLSVILFGFFGIKAVYAQGDTDMNPAPSASSADIGGDAQSVPDQSKVPDASSQTNPDQGVAPVATKPSSAMPKIDAPEGDVDMSDVDTNFDKLNDNDPTAKINDEPSSPVDAD